MRPRRAPRRTGCAGSRASSVHQNVGVLAGVQQERFAGREAPVHPLERLEREVALVSGRHAHELGAVANVDWPALALAAAHPARLGRAQEQPGAGCDTRARRVPQLPSLEHEPLLDEGRAIHWMRIRRALHTMAALALGLERLEAREGRLVYAHTDFALERGTRCTLWITPRGSRPPYRDRRDFSARYAGLAAEPIGRFRPRTPSSSGTARASSWTSCATSGATRARPRASSARRSGPRRRPPPARRRRAPSSNPRYAVRNSQNAWNIASASARLFVCRYV